MQFFGDLHARLDGLLSRVGADVDAAALPSVIDGLPDDALMGLMADAAAIANSVERLRVVGAGVVAKRSTRERGQGGLAATQGHRSPSELIQALSGGTRADADRHVRLGSTLVTAVSIVPTTDPDANPTISAPLPSWDAGLREALLAGRMTAPQHDAILRGLGGPPVLDGEDSRSETAAEVWAFAAEQLIVEARTMPAEELHRRARQVRDTLDTAGAEERFAKRFARRSFRTWVDGDGVRHGRFVYDDEMGAWVQAILDAALRPRRGGPRFVDAAEQAAADALSKDPRTNEQLAYDVMMDVLRAGALADAKTVFGARQPGVRVVTVKDAAGPRDAFGRMLGVGHVEDRGDPLPPSVVEKAVCQTGIVDVTVDSCGNPLDVGREQRLFTPKQRIALTVRDGGCVFPGCTVPASYCEAHHCDHWWEHLGNTDIDRGVLLCRFHHLLLHNQGWRITRDRHGPFVLHPPGRDRRNPVELTSKSPLKWSWDPPPDRGGWRAA